jgi:hypothetical protein
MKGINQNKKYLNFQKLKQISIYQGMKSLIVGMYIVNNHKNLKVLSKLER